MHVATKTKPNHIRVNKNRNTDIGIWDEPHPRAKSTDVTIMGQELNTLVESYIPAHAVALALQWGIRISFNLGGPGFHQIFW